MQPSDFRDCTLGFGPKDLMISGSFWAIDCITGAGYCRNTNKFEEYPDQVEMISDAQQLVSWIGDTQKLVGITITSALKKQISRLAIEILKMTNILTTSTWEHIKS